LFITVPLFADSHVRIVRLSYLDGDVEIDKGDGRGFNTAYLNMPVVHQSKVWARDGQTEVELEDGSSIRLTPDTIVAFNDLSLDNNGGRSTSIELQQGTAYFDIHHHDADHFELQFARDRIDLQKSARFRVDLDKHDISVAVLSGEIELANASGTQVAIKKDETIRLDSDDPDRYYLAKGVDAENYDSWDNDRAKWHDQSVSTASNNGISYGMSDLTAYGNYFYVPGYGNMWRPASAGMGWDPFADGYWVLYPGFGYTFVSGYPWGWAPYRYGSWQFVNGYGWCWAPGSNWNSWHAVPPLQHMPPHFHPPQVPHHGAAPVMAVNNGVTVPVPSHGIYVDNDTLEHHRPHSTRITTDSGEVVRQRPGAPGVPAQGLVSPAAVPGPSAPVGAPAVAGAPGATPVVPRFGGPRRGDRGDRENGHQAFRGPQFNPNRLMAPAAAMGPASSTQAPAQTTVAPAPAMAPPRMTPAPRMTPMASPTPRMESHSSAPAPAMRPMSSPSAGMSSGGGARMSSPSMGGGGAHAGGGSGGSHASHH